MTLSLFHAREKGEFTGWRNAFNTLHKYDKLHHFFCIYLFFYLFISRFVHIEYIQVLEQKDIASPTRFNDLQRMHYISELSFEKTYKFLKIKKQELVTK